MNCFLRAAGLGALILSTAACATSYNPEMGLTGGSEVNMITPTRAVVTFSGNGYTSETKTRQYVMLRAAELTNERGYTHFVILDRSVDVDRSSFTSVSYYGGYGYGSTAIIEKPSNTLEIEMLMGNPEPGNPVIFSAAEVINTIRPTLAK